MFVGISSDLSGRVKDFPESALPCPCIPAYDNRPRAANFSQESKGSLFAHSERGFTEVRSEHNNSVMVRESLLGHH